MATAVVLSFNGEVPPRVLLRVNPEQRAGSGR